MRRQLLLMVRIHRIGFLKGVYKGSIVGLPVVSIVVPVFRILTMKLVNQRKETLLGGSWDLVSTGISTLTGVITSYKYSYLIYNHSY